MFTNVSFFNLHLLIQTFPSRISIIATTAPLVGYLCQKLTTDTGQDFYHGVCFKFVVFFNIISSHPHNVSKQIHQENIFAVKRANIT